MTVFGVRRQTYQSAGDMQKPFSLLYEKGHTRAICAHWMARFMMDTRADVEWISSMVREVPADVSVCKDGDDDFRLGGLAKSCATWLRTTGWSYVHVAELADAMGLGFVVPGLKIPFKTQKNNKLYSVVEKANDVGLWWGSMFSVANGTARGILKT